MNDEEIITYEDLQNANEILKKLYNARLRRYEDFRLSLKCRYDVLLKYFEILSGLKSIPNICVNVDIFLHNFRNDLVSSGINPSNSELYLMVESYMLSLQANFLEEIKELLDKYLNKNLFSYIKENIYIFLNKESKFKINEELFIKKYLETNNRILYFNVDNHINQIYENLIKNFKNSFEMYDRCSFEENCNYEFEKMGFSSRIGNKKVPKIKNSNMMNANLGIILNIFERMANKDGTLPSDINKKIIKAIELFSSGKYKEYDILIDEIINDSLNYDNYKTFKLEPKKYTKKIDN